MSKVNIAIDGPAASGKGTVARGVAKALGFQYVDTGAMFRAVAVLAMREGIPYDDHGALAQLVRRLQFRFRWKNQHLALHVDGEDMSTYIELKLRDRAQAWFLRFKAYHGAVNCTAKHGQRWRGSDGWSGYRHCCSSTCRGQGFLIADARVRAERRFQELVARGERVAFDTVLEELVKRDQQDQNRKIAPLKKAPDATVLDSTKMDAAGVIDAVLALTRQAKLYVNS